MVFCFKWNTFLLLLCVFFFIIFFWDVFSRMLKSILTRSSTQRNKSMDFPTYLIFFSIETLYWMQIMQFVLNPIHGFRDFELQSPMLKIPSRNVVVLGPGDRAEWQIFFLNCVSIYNFMFKIIDSSNFCFNFF